MSLVSSPWRFRVSILALLSLVLVLLGGAVDFDRQGHGGVAVTGLLALDEATSPTDMGDDLAQLSPSEPAPVQFQRSAIPESPVVFTSQPFLPPLRPPRIA